MTGLHKLARQRPGFLVCVPVRHDGQWPGVAARGVEGHLRALGNPINKQARAAIDAAGCIHFISLSVIWDGTPADPPTLILDVSADGHPVDVLGALVDHAGEHLLPAYEAACGVTGTDALKVLLVGHLVAATPLPMAFSGMTVGLPFQGTPGQDRYGRDHLTVGRIRVDAAVEEVARRAVLNYGQGAHAAAGVSAVSYVHAALREVERDDRCRGGLTSATPLDQPAPGAASNVINRIVTQTTAAYLPVGLLVLNLAGLAWFFLLSDMLVKPPFWLSVPVFIVLIATIAVVTALIWIGGAAGVLAWVLRTLELSDRQDDLDPDLRVLREIMARENKCPQNHMTGVSTIKPGFFRQHIFLGLGLYVVFTAIKAKIFRPGFLSNLGTIHFAQWIVLPGTRKLLFLSNYDGSWESYLEDFITKATPGLTCIWSNTENFPQTNWLFFDGAQDGDRFKRWARRQQIPTLCWYSAYPELTTQQIRNNVAVRVGLAQAKADTLTETAAENWLKLFGSAPRPVYEIETSEIQGLVLDGYRNLFESACLVIGAAGDGPADVRAWLAELYDDVSFDLPSEALDRARIVGLSARGFAHLGLGGVFRPDGEGRGAALESDFSAAFVLGMTSDERARILGDVGEKAPDKWAWGGPDDAVLAVLMLYARHASALVTERGTQVARLERHGLRARPIRLGRWPDPGKPITEPFGFVDGISQPGIAGVPTPRPVLPKDLLQPGEFILGYLDGRGYFPPTPFIDEKRDPKRNLPDLPAGFPSPTEPATQMIDLGRMRDLGQNGSYLVIRQLEQDVDGFDRFLTAAAGRLARKGIPNPREWIAAKMVGRWKNGAPTISNSIASPPGYDSNNADNAFMFGQEDPQGLGCPFGAHIRRANPRDGLNADDPNQLSITNRHRIIRRGRAYVPGDNPSAGGAGLLFMCLNADIQRQFEFVQQTWLSSNAFTGLQGELDPLTANSERDSIFTIPTLSGPERIEGLQSFAKPVGGGYFFLPGKRALAYLAGLPASAAFKSAAEPERGLKASGRLLIETPTSPILAALARQRPFTLPGYQVRPISLAPEPKRGLDLRLRATEWVIAKPGPGVRLAHATPWDHAHAVAEKHGYRLYVEPDILHERAPPPGNLVRGFDANWPPDAPAGARASAGWHLGDAFTGFLKARATASGAGVWIAHLDTGYRPDFQSNPRNLHPELGYDCWLDQPDPIDPLDAGLLAMPGHGTATAALLAGAAVELPFNSVVFKDDLGGAPAANVIPIRIGPSAIQAWTASMAQGIDLARQRTCDVASISHGGAPSQAWAAMVNRAYDAGVIMVGAAGDNIEIFGPIDFASRFTVYPAAFNRVITAVGATYDKGPFKTGVPGEIQGCWGPTDVMCKAVAAYSANVVWMRADKPPSGFSMGGRGTSIAAPLIAAACALWLELYGKDLPRNWLRIEACRRALFGAADKAGANYDADSMGEGVLNVTALLDPDLAKTAIAEAKRKGRSQQDAVEFALFRILAGIGPPGGDIEEKMYETEMAQIVHASPSRALRAGAAEAHALRAAGKPMPAAEQSRQSALLHAEPLSAALRRRLPIE